MPGTQFESSQDHHSFFKSILASPIIRAIIQIAIAGILTFGVGVFGPIAAALSGATVTGLAGGKLGDMLRAGLIAGGTALAFMLVGNAAVAVAQTFGSASVESC